MLRVVHAPCPLCLFILLGNSQYKFSFTRFQCLIYPRPVSARPRQVMLAKSTNMYEQCIRFSRLPTRRCLGPCLDGTQLFLTDFVFFSSKRQNCPIQTIPPVFYTSPLSLNIFNADFSKPSDPSTNFLLPCPAYIPLGPPRGIVIN